MSFCYCFYCFVVVTVFFWFIFLHSGLVFFFFVQANISIISFILKCIECSNFSDENIRQTEIFTNFLNCFFLCRFSKILDQIVKMAVLTTLMPMIFAVWQWIAVASLNVADYMSPVRWPRKSHRSLHSQLCKYPKFFILNRRIFRGFKSHFMMFPIGERRQSKHAAHLQTAIIVRMKNASNPMKIKPRLMIQFSANQIQSIMAIIWITTKIKLPR